MAKSDYFVLNIKNLDSSLEDWLSQEVFSAGALGISEALPFSQPEGEEEVFSHIPDRRSLDIYFSEPPPPDLIALLRARCAGAEVQVRGEANRDWLSEWKKGFKPFALAGGHWVVPSWCDPPPEAKQKIWLDPGMAFGTGTHETTQLVSEMLLELVDANPPGTLLDVGTGTGILAILAKQLGVKRVSATEIEADSRRVAHENFAANKVQIELDDRQVEDLHEKFDVVVANIIDGVLVRIQTHLRACVKPGGWLVVSGIILEREQEFLAGFVPPTEWAARRQKGDWLLFAVRL